MQLIDRASSAVIHKSPRLVPLDALRGLIIVLMALDHANVFVAQKHSSGEYWGGDFPVYSDSLAFLTRLVTHLAAPGFFFLMGAGMVLMADARRRQGQGYQEIIPHFWIRGIVLIALHLFMYKGMGQWLTPVGTSILTMYPYWLAVLLGLLPMCFFYREFKQRPPMNRVLRYL